MIRRHLLPDALLLTIIWYVLLPSPACAYFDINFATLFIQVLLGFGATLWLTCRSHWKQFVRKVDPQAKTATGAAEPAKEEK